MPCPVSYDYPPPQTRSEADLTRACAVVNTVQHACSLVVFTGPRPRPHWSLCIGFDVVWEVEAAKELGDGNGWCKVDDSVRPVIAAGKHTTHRVDI